MLVSHDREKLIQAIIFFAQHTHCLGKTKLFKLLYFLDFEHFRQVGRPVTGLQYHAWKMGPVPEDLSEEVDEPEPDLAERVRFREIPVRNWLMLTVTARVQFDPSLFTKRELRLLSSLAEEYRDAVADDMIEATHVPGLPWHRVYVLEGRKREPIPYEYALSGEESVLMAEHVAERKDFLSVYAA